MAVEFWRIRRASIFSFNKLKQGENIMKTERLADVAATVALLSGILGLWMLNNLTDGSFSFRLISSLLLGAMISAGSLFLLYRFWNWLPRSFRWGTAIALVLLFGVGGFAWTFVVMNQMVNNKWDAMGWAAIQFAIAAVTFLVARTIYIATGAIDQLTLYRIMLLDALILAFVGALYKISQTETFPEHLPWIATFAFVAVSILVIHQKLFRKFHPKTDSHH